MTQQEIEGTPFYAPVVCKALCREYMACILSYQSGRRSFYLSRKYTKSTEVLPESATTSVASLGSLNVHTGVLTVRQSVKDLLSQYEAWTDFNWADAE